MKSEVDQISGRERVQIEELMQTAKDSRNRWAKQIELIQEKEDEKEKKKKDRKQGRREEKEMKTSASDVLGKRK